MSGIDLQADTNFIIYLLEGREETQAFAGFSFAISFVTEIELLGRKGIDSEEIDIIQELIDTCVVVDLNPAIKAKAIELKQHHRIKLPDALVAATAFYTNLPLLTADKGFSSLPDLGVLLLSLKE